MKTVLKALMIVAVLSCTTATSFAADKNERTDKAAFDRLARELREVHRKYSQAYGRGVAEARENNGKATLETKATILSLRDEIDRKTTRLLLIALRHGWDVPQFNGQNRDSSAQASSRKEQVFSPVDDLIRTAFAQEARQLAIKVRLPIVSISAGKKAPGGNGLLALLGL